MRQATVLALLLAGSRAEAADPFEAGPVPDAAPAPRYFPRADEGAAGAGRRLRSVPRRLAACVPRRAPVPSDAPDDPSYVGSAYGLSKPAYYGFRPALGHDDPFGRPLLPYCP